MKVDNIPLALSSHEYRVGLRMSMPPIHFPRTEAVNHVIFVAGAQIAVDNPIRLAGDIWVSQSEMQIKFDAGWVS
jgi:hypothetical protein